MGNYCQICKEDKANHLYDPTKRQFLNTSTVMSIVPVPTSNPLAYSSVDAPNPTRVKANITIPQISSVIQDILTRQNATKSFEKQLTSGTRFPPFEILDKGMIYNGEWSNGVPHGYAQVFYLTGGYFQGYFQQGIAACNDGIFIYPDGTFYRGQIKDSSANGNGILIYRNGEMVYSGTWLNDKPHGRGKQQYKDGSSYTGSFIEGTKQGNGMFRWRDGSQYIGQFKDGYMHGQGQQKMNNGERYKGTFFRNKRQGWGQMENNLGHYKGQFFENKKAGQGQFRFKDGRFFKGGFFDDLPEGFGTMKMSNGESIIGVWRRGQNVQIQNNEVQLNSAFIGNGPPTPIRTSTVSIMTNVPPLGSGTIPQSEDISRTMNSKLATTMQSIMKRQP